MTGTSTRSSGFGAVGASTPLMGGLIWNIMISCDNFLTVLPTYLSNECNNSNLPAEYRSIVCSSEFNYGKIVYIVG